MAWQVQRIGVPGSSLRQLLQGGRTPRWPSFAKASERSVFRGLIRRGSGRLHPGLFVSQRQERVALGAGELAATVFPQEQSHKEKNQPKAEENRDGYYRHAWIELGSA